MVQKLEAPIEPRLRKFCPYPEYKESELGWLGKVPTHWDVIRTKLVARLESGHTPSRQNPEYWENCTIPWFGLADVWQIRDGRREYVSETNEKVSELGLAHSAARLLPKGTVILSRTASVGFSAIMDTDMATTQDFVNWVPGPRIRSDYLLYVFRAMTHEFRRLTMGSTHQTIYMPDVGRFCTPVPPVEEQERVVGFIRGEVAKIDALVEKKERLIELLQEKRTALITQIVTKGLDPRVPMKDSRVEWLGEIPAHWEAKRLKHLSSQIIDGAHLTPTYVSEGVPFLRVTDIHQKQIDLDLVKRVPREEHRELSKRCCPQKGDLLVSKNGTIGVPRVVDWDWEFSIFVSLCLIKLGNKLKAEYASYYFLSWALGEQIAFGGKKNTITNLHLDRIREFVLSVPPPEEQSAAVFFLDREVGRLDNLVSRVSHGIERLREFRTALTSAAVTGKIDVREEAA